MENNQFLFEAPQEILNEIQAINNKIDEKGYITKKDADRFITLSRKHQVCNTCHRPYREIKMGMLISLPGRNGAEYNVCFEPTCMECNWKSWSMDPEVNPGIFKP